MIKAMNKNFPIEEKSLFVVIANIEIPPNATDVIKNACPTIDAPPGMLKIDVNKGAIVKPEINVNANNTAKLRPGVCLTFGITKKIKASSTANKTHLTGPIKIETIPNPIYAPAVAANNDPANS